MTKYITVKLNSNTVTTYVRNYKIDKRISSDALIDECNIEFFKSCSPVPAVGQTIEIYSGYSANPTVRKFYGIVRDVQTSKEIYKAKCLSRLVLAADALVNTVYNSNGSTAGVVSAIVDDLFETYAGLTCSVVTTPDVISKFICRNTDVLERCVLLAHQVDYDIHYDHDADVVYFRPREYSTNSGTIYIGTASNSVSQAVKWKDIGIQDLFNKLTIYGATVYVSDTKSFTASAAQTTTTLSHIPDVVKVTKNGTEQVGGLSGSTTSYDYQVDRENKKITWAVAFAGGESVVVTYYYNVPVPVQMQDATSIAAYGTIHKIFTFTDLTTVDDAIQRGQRLLNNYKNPFKLSELYLLPDSVNTLNPQVGQRIRVTDNLVSINDYFVIKQATEEYPEKGMLLTISDKELKWQSTEISTQLRIKRLEEQLNEGDQVVSQVITGGADAAAARTTLEALAARVNDSFILGHWLNGQLARGIILDDFESSPLSNWTGTSCTLSEQTA